MQKHSVMIFGHSTSFSLETEFWQELKSMAAREKITIASLIERIDQTRTGHLSSAIRLYILRSLKQEITDNKQSQ
ncbi:MAG: ribbon-helix-helix domain-containing protein [Pseudomonadota bacterium]|nr:ribbon-helix-helix domain-containing protein [Pseudomonadota bacterium]